MIKRLMNQGWTVQAGDRGGLSALFGGLGEPPKPVNLPHGGDSEESTGTERSG